MCLEGTSTIGDLDSSFFFLQSSYGPQIQSGSKGLLGNPRSKLKRLSVRDYGLSLIQIFFTIPILKIDKKDE